MMNNVVFKTTCKDQGSAKWVFEMLHQEEEYELQNYYR